MKTYENRWAFPRMEAAECRIDTPIESFPFSGVEQPRGRQAGVFDDLAQLPQNVEVRRRHDEVQRWAQPFADGGDPRDRIVFRTGATRDTRVVRRARRVSGNRTPPGSAHVHTKV